MKKVSILTSLLVSTLSLSISTNAFAISDKKVVETCLEKGKEKITMVAESNYCVLDLNATFALEVDNRWYNPSKYVWYAVEAQCEDGWVQIIKLVQYYKGECI